MLALLLIPLLVAPAALHTTYSGNLPNARKADSIIRQVSTQDPTKGATNPAVNCGPDAGPATLVGNANPGSIIEFDWTGGDGKSNWPHDTGPMLTYMASCGSTTCDKFDSTTAKWFKIDQVGLVASGKWGQADLQSGKTAKVTIPTTLAPGNYLIRHEIIALHLAVTKGGAEFYPSCTQLTIGGSQSGQPTSDELVSLPGAYSDTDPGIFNPAIFDPGLKYQFPGPKVAAFVSGTPSASGESDNDDTEASNSDGLPDATTAGQAAGTATGGATSGTASGTAAATGTKTRTSSSKPTATSASNNASSGNSGKQCKIKKKSSSSSAATASGTPAVDANVVQYRPRHISRVMRSLKLGSTY
ncbi:glycosyl hydrolase family 61-domain-containing protein [Cyathus striatus]|nr:glycosyl hydrolase family 61-domain-containing protein [Cyathus striatus]